MSASPLLRRLKLRLDPSGEDPLSRQIVDELWVEVVEGTLPTGERLPTARELAISLGISPRSVKRAYEELERLGVAVTRAGEGTFVSLSPPPDEERRRLREFARLCRDTVREATRMGFSVTDLVDAIGEFREMERTETDE